VIAVLRTCHRLGVPVVPRGAGTGLSGGATPHSQGVVLSTARFNRIVSVDRLAQQAVVQPGVRNLAVSEAAAPHGLYYAPDPSSQIACSIGGNVAENSGGVHCLKYGLTVHNVLRVRMVSMTGEVMEIGSAAPDSPGYDLLAITIGSEGLLGVVTEVTVKLVPKPRVARCVLACLRRCAARRSGGGGHHRRRHHSGRSRNDGSRGDGGGRGVRARRLSARCGGHPAVRIRWNGRGSARRNRPCSRAARCGGRHRGPRFAATKPSACASGPGARRRSRRRPNFAGLLLHGRHHSAQAAGRHAGSDGRDEKKYDLRCLNVFHAGDGNLHPLILFDSNDPDSLHRAEAFGVEILELSVALGGTITGEHGVGSKRSTRCACSSRRMNWTCSAA
jgi:glycolate oxidase